MSECFDCLSEKRSKVMITAPLVEFSNGTTPKLEAPPWTCVKTSSMLTHGTSWYSSESNVSSAACVDVSHDSQKHIAIIVLERSIENGWLLLLAGDSRNVQGTRTRNETYERPCILRTVILHEEDH